MDKKKLLLDLVVKQGMLPLFFYKDTQVSIEVLKTLYNAGVRAFEYTNRGQEALANFKEMIAVRDAELPGMYLGIGTIKDSATAELYIAAKADFLVCPGLIEEVLVTANAHDILAIPGCMTPSEIIRAESLGAKFVKLFPGNVLGHGFASAIKELFPKVTFMPTGGVDLDKANMAAWFKAGVSAVGMGSKLISKDLLQSKDYAKIEANTKEAFAIIESIRNPS